MSREEEGRGVFLTGLLVFLVVENLLKLAGTVGGIGHCLFRKTPPSAPSWEIIVWGAMSVMNLVLVAVVWNWKRWGVYALALSLLITIVLSLGFELSTTPALAPLVGLAVFVILLRRRWRYFE